MIIDIINKLDVMIPNPKCELNYTKDYELLIAVMLSAQCTDKRVNIVTKELFRYNLEELSIIPNKELERIIVSLGTHKKKAEYIKCIASSLIENYDGRVPNDRNYLMTLPGVGRKTINVVLSILYNVPCIAVDTHVHRVSNRLNIVKNEDNVLKIEKILTKKIPKDKINRVGEQLVLFGRYICKAKNPKCDECLFSCKQKDEK